MKPPTLPIVRKVPCTCKGKGACAAQTSTQVTQSCSEDGGDSVQSLPCA